MLPAGKAARSERMRAVLLALAALGAGRADTLLEEYFCGIYYPADAAAQGLPPCEAVQASPQTSPHLTLLPISPHLTAPHVVTSLSHLTSPHLIHQTADLIPHPTARDGAITAAPRDDQVRAAVVSDLTGPLPTLSLGDPAKPALFFVHGWPDR
jgi:hypothetical protein